jgi:hypothetical protein
MGSKPTVQQISHSHRHRASVIEAFSTFWQKTRNLTSSAHELLVGPILDDRPYKATRHVSCYTILLHLVPVAGVAVLVALNLYGYWVGKELSGVKNQNAPKTLALQLTAKLHELLMLASLSEALLTHLLKSLVNRDGLPFGSLTASDKFKDLSYIWSRDFRAMCTTEYNGKRLLIPTVLLCTIFGLAVGPSSATALIPRLDTWHAGKAMLALNSSDALLWPSTLETNNINLKTCTDVGLGCLNSLVWSSLGANFFSYWGHLTVGGGDALPQHVNAPGVGSLRTMDIRLGLAGSPNPDCTIASVQHAVVGDLVTSFRFLTFPSRSAKCKRSWSPAMCSYLDLSWFVEAQQPVVFTACAETSGNASQLSFPVIHGDLSPRSVRSTAFKAKFTDQSLPQVVWLNNHDPSIRDASIGAVVRLNDSAGIQDYTCTIKAQWAESISATSFLGTNYVVDGTVSGMDYATPINKKYRGQTVTINPEWAQELVEAPAEIRSGINTTALEHFMSLGNTTSRLSLKLEAALSVLFAESMAHTGSGAVPLSIASNDLYLKRHGFLLPPEQLAPTTPRMEFNMKTSMTGYGYGLYTMSGLSLSTLISIVLLCLYLAFTTAHLVSLFISGDPYIVSWRDERELLMTCLWSPFNPALLRPNINNAATQGTTTAAQVHDDEETRLLGEIVVIMTVNDRAELCFRQL